MSFRLPKPSGAHAGGGKENGGGASLGGGRGGARPVPRRRSADGVAGIGAGSLRIEVGERDEPAGATR